MQKNNGVLSSNEGENPDAATLSPEIKLNHRVTEELKTIIIEP